jgi:hypothetical protein
MAKHLPGTDAVYPFTLINGKKGSETSAELPGIRHIKHTHNILFAKK